MKVKNEYQNYFKRKCFTHQITLPPSPITEKNVVSCLNEIVFKLNKTFLKSSFPKYDMTDTFRFFIFPEDKNINLYEKNTVIMRVSRLFAIPTQSMPYPETVYLEHSQKTLYEVCMKPSLFNHSRYSILQVFR